MSELYQKMKSKGVNMSWYDRASSRRPQKSIDVALDDEECSRNSSIYYQKADGSLWTVDSTGAPYKQVRPVSDEVLLPGYICVKCGQQWGEMPKKHSENSKEATVASGDKK